MNINRSVSINARILQLQNSIQTLKNTLAGYDLYLRSVEQLLLNKNITTKEELDTIRKQVIEAFLTNRKTQSNIVIASQENPII